MDWLASSADRRIDARLGAGGGVNAGTDAMVSELRRNTEALRAGTQVQKTLWGDRLGGLLNRATDLSQGGLAGSLTGMGGLRGAMAGFLVNAVPSLLGDIGGLAAVRRNASLTGEEKLQSGLSRIPVVGGLLDKFARSIREANDALSGVTERRRQEGLRTELSMLRVSLASQREQELMPHRQALDAARAAVIPFYGARATPYSYEGGAFSAGGLVGHGEAQRRIAAQDALEAARRQQHVDELYAYQAGRRVSEEQSNVGRLDRRLRSLEQEEREILRRSGGGRLSTRPLNDASGYVAAERSGTVFSSRNAADLERVRNLQREALTERQAALQRLSQLEQENGRAAVQAARSASEARKASIAHLKEEMEILEAREGRLRSGAEALGRATPQERAVFGQLARRVQEQGFESLHYQERDLYERFAGDSARLAYQRMGEATEEHRYLRDVAREYGTEAVGQRIEDVMRQRVQASVTVRNEIILDQAQLAEDTARLLAPALERIHAALLGRDYQARLIMSVEQAIRASTAAAAGG